MSQRRRNFTGAEKVAVLKRHLVDGQAVSDICDELGIQPAQFYTWQKRFFENGAAAFERSSSPRKNGVDDRVKRLEAKLQKKHEVLSELMEEHVALKKSLGEN